jgi:RNA polymerase sigma-70 factor, ECF subfamily
MHTEASSQQEVTTSRPADQATGRSTPPSAEAKLVAAARRGDRGALGLLLRFNRSRIERMCRRMAGSDGFEDLVQETYVAVIRNIHSFRGDSAFLTWVYAICRSRYSRWCRRKAQAEALSRRTAPGIVDQAGDDQRRWEMGRSLTGALHELSQIDRRVLVLRDLQGFSTAEVAWISGLTVPAVKTRLHRARTAMREVLSRDEAEATAPRTENDARERAMEWFLGREAGAESPSPRSP